MVSLVAVLALAGAFSDARAEKHSYAEKSGMGSEEGMERDGLSDKLEEHFDAAAAEIEKAASLLHKEAEGESEEVKKSLNEQADKLEALADDVREESVESVEMLEDSFREAYYEVAKPH